MRPTFNIVATPALQNRYRSALQDDFTEASLQEVLALVRRVLETSGYQIRFDWEGSATRQRRPTYPIPLAANDYLRDFLERANADIAPELPEEVPETTTLERTAYTAAVFLTFQSRVNVEGHAAFLRDAQSLLFQLCIHVLSPKLRSKQLVDADGHLMHALYAHAKIAWTDQPAHYSYLLAALFEHTGQQEEAMALLRASLNDSSVDEHDFVTKAQAYWSMLIESNRIDEAKTFLLEMYRRAARKDLVELQELLDETYAVEGANLRAS